MDPNDEFAIDPAIAAAMGFSNFGSAPNKKRKYDNDGFIDPDIARGKPQGTSANNLPIGERKATTTKAAAAAAGEQVASDSSSQQVPFRPEQSLPAGGSSTSMHETNSDGTPTLQALRNGVRNENGDLAIFLPSFIVDPWAGLKAQ